MDKLTKKNLLQARKQIEKQKRVGYKVNNKTVVMTINDKPITYKVLKKLLKII